MDARLTLAVALPHTTRPTTVEWAVRLATLGYPLNTSYVFIMTKSVELGEARCLLANQALKMNAKYILFLDDDTIPPVDAVKKLMNTLASNPAAAIAGGIYPMRDGTNQPVVFRKLGEGPEMDWAPGEVFEADAIGGGCMMVKTEVFADLDEPWFNNGGSDNGGQRNTWSEDTYFCAKVKKAGWKVLAHAGVLCDHYDVKNDKMYTLKTPELVKSE